MLSILLNVLKSICNVLFFKGFVFSEFIYLTYYDYFILSGPLESMRLSLTISLAGTRRRWSVLGGIG